MRKLPYLLVLLLLSLLLLAAAASAHAATVPVPGEPTALTAPVQDEEDDEGDEGEAEEAEEAGEDDEGEDCAADEDELCEEELEAEGDEACVIEDASSSVVVAPGSGKVLLTVRYHSFESAMVTIDARLRGGKGGLHLGSERAQFRRAGAFRDSFSLGSKQLGKALAAREFDVDLHAVGTPAECRLHLSTRGSRRAR